MQICQVYQIRMKLFLLQDIKINEIQEKTASFLDKSFGCSESLLKMHEENRFKYYSFDFPYLVDEDKRYKKGKIYTLTIRTIDSVLANHFLNRAVNCYTEDIKGLTAEIRILPRKVMDCLYTLTPAILKDERGYWKDCMGVEEFENRLKVNLIKKWNQFYGEKLAEDFPLYTMIEFLNDKPIGMEYKNIKLLGDKIRLRIAEHETAQKLAYMALGTGLLEMNSRGAGFVNYRWL